MSNLDEYHFSKSHEWISPTGTVGLSDHAQKEITDVVFVDLPKVGREVKQGESIAVVESVKAAFDIYAPLSGKIVKVNEEVPKNPAIVNQSPYENGWLFSMEPANDEDLTKLMTLSEYQKFLESNSH